MLIRQIHTTTTKSHMKTSPLVEKPRESISYLPLKAVTSKSVTSSSFAQVSSQRIIPKLQKIGQLLL